MLDKLKKDLERAANLERAEHSKRYFKTGPGQYGEGDVFLGLTVPEQRKIAIKYKEILLEDVEGLLKSKIHEHRLVALLILVQKFQKADEKTQKEIVNFYLNNTDHINNWDLVDLSAGKILGSYLLKKNKSILYRLAKSNHLWEKRISIIATSHFIGNNKFEDTLKISEILLKDKHDLIHKAVGWMLREIGKRDPVVEEAFLEKHYKKMPRTMLRYAIERFDKEKKTHFMKKD